MCIRRSCWCSRRRPKSSPCKQAIEQTENNISILLGKNPGAIPRGLNLIDAAASGRVPAGLPSALLQRRPDVRRDEENLVAANANVGVAKAAFFPQISLTGQFGAKSTAITSFLQGPATFWAVGGQLAQPIFEGGRIRSGYRLAWAQRDEAELTYKQTVLSAFGDVSNSLVGYNDARLFRIKIEEEDEHLQRNRAAGQCSLQGGVTSFLEVLVTEQDYFTSELQLSQAWFRSCKTTCSSTRRWAGVGISSRSMMRRDAGSCCIALEFE